LITTDGQHQPLTPRQQHARLGTRGRRSRPRVSDELIRSAARRVTGRDRRLCGALLDHRVLTADQIADLAFSSRRRAQARLQELWGLRVVDRFQPYRPTGSAPYHYVLDEVGAVLVAADRGVDVRALGYRRLRAIALSSSQRLGHLVGVNATFTGLARVARASGGRAELAYWWPEQRCAEAWGRLVRPDGYGVWAQDGASISFFLEYDLGTEPARRLADKLDGYAELAEATGRAPWVLFWFPSARREADARRAMLGAPAILRIATAAPLPGQTAADAIWARLGVEATRRRLIDLGRASISRE
jgi:hypothetical protein